MADEQNQQTGAVQGGTSAQQSGSASASSPATVVGTNLNNAGSASSEKKENSVNDLLAMWASDDVVIGEKNAQVKPAQLETQPAPKPIEPQPVVKPVSVSGAVAPAFDDALVPTPTPRPVPTPEPILSSQVLVKQEPVVIAPLKPIAPLPVVSPAQPQVQSLPPRPVAPAPVLQPQPQVQSLPPRPVAPAPVLQPQPQAQSLPPRPVAPAPVLQPQPQAQSLPPRPVASAPVLTPQPLPQPPRPTPPAPPRPAPPTPVMPRPPPPQQPLPQSTPQPIPRPAQPVQAPKPAPTPSRPEPVKKIDNDAIEAELVDDDNDEDSALAAANILSSIKNKEETQDADDGEGFMAQFKELMQELNFSPAKILRIIGCIAVFIGLVYAIHLGWVAYGGALLEKIGLGNSTTTDNNPTQKTEENKNIPQAGTQNTIESGIAGSVQVGEGVATEPIQINDIGIKAGVVIGEAARAVTPFAKYITQFKLMENAYQVDINKLLNQSTDRRARFKSQLALMNALYKEANETLGEVQQEMDITNGELTKRTTEQNTTEKSFFEQMTALNGQVAEGLLSDFTRSAQQVVTLKARYRALQKLAALYTNGLPRFERRIRDLELNQEPLISGLKVYDVAGSDLELIVPVQDSGTTPRSTSSPVPTSSRPAIAPIISPQEFKDVSGGDYITQPGGGF